MTSSDLAQALRGVVLALAGWVAATLPSSALAQAACGAGTVDRTVVGTEVINRYLPGPSATMLVPAGATSLPVAAGAARGDATPIAAGDFVMIVQMQGAAIDPREQTVVDGVYGDGPGGDDRMGVFEGRADFLAGRYELNVAAGPVSGGALPLEFPTRAPFAISNGVTGLPGPLEYGQARYQVVRIPVLRDLTVPAGATVTGVPWNGRSGGVVSVDVGRTLTLDGLIDASGLGFRGGSPVIPCSAADPQCDSPQPAIRGEGIAGTPNRVYSRAAGLVTGLGNAVPGGNSGRGGAGNAGGSPTGNNDSGGGGGGGGGPGGAGAIGPGTGTAANEPRPGAGYQLTERVFLGGGGGSGSLDDLTTRDAVSGQAGGGVLYLRAVTITGTGTLRANGDGGATQPQEGGGGGGGGGTIFVRTDVLDLSSITIEALGGDGADTTMSDDGAGGGGGGGFVVIANPVGMVTASPNVSGGAGGTGGGGSGGSGDGGFQQLTAQPLASVCPGADFDGDVFLDAVDKDDDNDGVLDSVETNMLFGSLDPSGDEDRDGVPNYLDLDAWTAIGMAAACMDTGPADGECDETPAPIDADGDGLPNHLDRDADGDGITDVYESGGTDANGDGVPDGCVAVDASGGCVDGAGATLIVGSPPDTDRDGALDLLDPDADEDGLSDAIESRDDNGDGALGGGETVASGADADGDGIDDAFDPDAGGGDPLTPPFAAGSTQDENGDGTPDWLQACGDAYVTGTEACDDGNLDDTDACANVCLFNDGESCSTSAQCVNLCDASDGTCQACLDDMSGGATDGGCGAGAPFCDTSGAVHVCEPCVDSGGGVDEGCGAAAPSCFTGAAPNQCVPCLDSDAGAGMDDGCTGAAPFCDTSPAGGPATNVCQPCLDTAASGPDLGCSGAADICDDSGSANLCVDCEDTGAASSGSPDDGCAAGSPVCVGAGASASCEACADSDAGGGTDEGCAGGAPYCGTGGGAPMCQECRNDGDCPGSERCNAAGMCVDGCVDDGDCGAPTPRCDTSAMLCVACLVDADCGGGDICSSSSTCLPCEDDASGAGVDSGCSAATPVCDVAGASGRVCVECTDDSHCPGAASCDTGTNTCDQPDTDGDGTPDVDDLDDDDDGILDTVELGGTDLSDDDDGDGVPDWLDPDATPCTDEDGDGACEVADISVDLDRDGVPNHLDLDADGDGVPDATEGHDANRDGAPDLLATGADADMDGLDDAFDPDAGGTTAPTQDSDGDGRPDFLDGDSDDDGHPDRVEAFDVDRDGVADVRASGVDADGDGLDDAFDPDQGGTAAPAPDHDADGFPGYLDLDTDGDGIADDVECRDPTRCPDTDRDGTPDYLDVDTDGDGVPDATEGHDTDADGAPDRAPSGTDGDLDGLDDAYDPDDGGTIAPLPDRDGDGAPDWRDTDDDGDAVSTLVECPDFASGCPDEDGDGTPDYLDPDTTPSDMDMDGIPDDVECRGDISTCPDTDGDGDPDHVDADDDGDGVPTRSECARFGACDTDGDGFDDHLDVDADDDGIRDDVECDAGVCPDTDGDGREDRLDLDADGDGVPDATEGHDADMDGVADRVASGADADMDGLDDAFDADQGGTAAPVQDTDGDGTGDWRDVDDDDDGSATVFECPDFAAGCPDTDMDGTPDYLDADDRPVDTDMDGIPDVVECPAPGDPVTDPASCRDSDGDGDPDFDDPDDDDDGIPTRDESYDGDGDPTDDDSDGDGRPDYLDPDDDDDTIPTAEECTSFAAGCEDTDGDGVPDYLDVCGDGTRTVLVPGVTAWEECDDGNMVDGDGCDMTCRLEPADPDGDDDMDGLLNSFECPPPADLNDPTTCPDADGDGMPDFRDPDDDDDSLPTSDEVGDGGMGAPRDSDGDGTPDYLDPDDDDDTIPTRTEVEDGRALDMPSDDVDGDGDPNWLDTDADGDGIPDMDEPGDADGNGVPDYLEDGPRTMEEDLGGLAGGALCSASPTPGSSAPWLLLLVGLGALLVRRRRRGAVLVAALALGLAAPSAASAQTQPTAVLDRYAAGETVEDDWHLSRPTDFGHLRFGAQLQLDYALNPLIFESTLGDVGTEAFPVVEHQLTGTVNVAFGLFDRLVLFAGLPITLVMDGDDAMATARGVEPADGAGLSDMVLGARGRLFGEADDVGALGLQLSATLPTAVPSPLTYRGEDHVTFLAELLGELRPGLGSRVVLNLGVRLRDEDATGSRNIEFRHELTYGLGFAIPVWTDEGEPTTHVDLQAQLYGSTAFAYAFEREHSPLEAIAGAKLFHASGLVAGLAGGLGLVRGFGSPDLRLVAMVGWAMPVEAEAEGPADRDGDGLTDDVDECPDEPEDRDEFEDANGCPDPDNDGDGILDETDECPNEPEIVNDLEDEDGCPDGTADGDGDGLYDHLDECPTEPEDADGFEDDNGCPDPDNDGDGVLDSADRCRDEPGVIENRGCPDSDRDGDTVVDRVDNCPDEAGTPENHGCAEEQQVVLSEGRLEILDHVYFRTNRAAIQSRSNALLMNVARVLNAHPEIERVVVEGHTDARGRREYNIRLSQQRAEAVVDFLVRRGDVDRGRLEARGFGPDQPIVEGASTPEEHAQNRRVEFRIPDTAGISQRSSGPGADTVDR